MQYSWRPVTPRPAAYLAGASPGIVASRMAPWRIGVRGKATAPPRGRGGTVYSLPWPTKLDKIKNLRSEVQAGPVGTGSKIPCFC